MEFNQLMNLYNRWIIADSVKYSISNCNTSSNIKEEFIELAATHSAINRMLVFYALEYVLIEGYREMQINDSRIDNLLNPDLEKKLKRLRNAVFHMQKDTISKKLLEFLETPDTEFFIKEIHKAFFDFFKKHMPIEDTLKYFRK